MHNEYGYDDTASDTNLRVVGLKSKFASRVRIVGLGRSSSIRGQRPDFDLEVAERDIHARRYRDADPRIEPQRNHPHHPGCALPRFWPGLVPRIPQYDPGSRPSRTKTASKVPANGSVEYWAREAGINEMAASALHSKLGRLYNKPYIVKNPPPIRWVKSLRPWMPGSTSSYPLAISKATWITCWWPTCSPAASARSGSSATNAHRSHDAKEPRPLVIVVEEAHKLLNREMAAQTTFSTIAREMRKYYVTLLIIDQRPSQIYDEVMSQLGTRISGWLGDENDIQAVLSGLAAGDSLRGMLARLQPKEEVVLLGWGVPMPLPVRSRRYDDRFWSELQGRAGGRKSEAETLKELGF